jgi:hypothetical protein
LFREKFWEITKEQKAALREAYKPRSLPLILRPNSQQQDPRCTAASPTGIDIPSAMLLTVRIACGLLCQYLMALFFVRKMFFLENINNNIITP